LGGEIKGGIAQKNESFTKREKKLLLMRGGRRRGEGSPSNRSGERGKIYETKKRYLVSKKKVQGTMPGEKRLSPFTKELQMI